MDTRNRAPEIIADEAAVKVSQIHPDDLAVDRFAAALKAKLAKKREDGRGGWEDKAQCPEGLLQEFLLSHLRKGDPVDIGNFAMMIFNRGEAVSGPRARPMDLLDDGWTIAAYLNPKDRDVMPFDLAAPVLLEPGFQFTIPVFAPPDDIMASRVTAKKEDS